GTQGPLLTVGGAFHPHWIDTACLKPSSPQTIKCYPVTACRTTGCLELRQNQKASCSPTPANTIIRKPSTLKRFASWNIRTMCPGFNTDPELVTDMRQTTIIDRELSRLNIDVACLQEIRLADSGSLT
ncbi:craniofacial development protein 2, partial [Biomphalaria glabrata]